jgi:hypothetical protein
LSPVLSLIFLISLPLSCFSFIEISEGVKKSNGLLRDLLSLTLKINRKRLPMGDLRLILSQKFKFTKKLWIEHSFNICVQFQGHVYAILLTQTKIVYFFHIKASLLISSLKIIKAVIKLMAWLHYFTEKLLFSLLFLF